MTTLESGESSLTLEPEQDISYLICDSQNVLDTYISVVLHEKHDEGAHKDHYGLAVR